MKFSLVLALLFTFVSCNQEKPSASKLQGGTSSSCSGDIASGSDSGPLFKIDGMTFESKDLPADIKQYVYKNKYDTYSKNQAVFKELAVRIYLAKQQGKFKDIKSLPTTSELMPVSPVSEAEAKKFFESNKNRMPPHATYSTMKDQLVKYLEGQKVSQVFRQKMTEIESKGLFTSLIAAPIAPEIKFDTSSFPTMGNKNAKVQIIEVSDYLCGHCQQAHPMVKNILDSYKGKIAFTQINFSLRPSALSGTYVRGSYCAQKMGSDKFWSYHDAAFKEASKPHDHSAHGHKGHEADNDGFSKGSVAKVVSVAKSIGLDVNAFEKCINSDAAKKFVTKTNKLISEKGINSTPVFIVNNKKLAQGVMELEEAIKKEL